ncbi:MAG: pilus assembly protein, partial [Candidatus Dadabacteria bacterium]
MVIPPSKDGGATYVEAAIATGVFLFFCLGLIEILQYFYVVIVLNFAVQQGVDLASKLELEVPTSTEDCQRDLESCNRYVARVRKIQNEVLRYANLVTSSADAGGRRSRIKFEHYYAPGQDNSPLHELVSEVAVVRPGEIVKSKNSPYNITFEVPTRKYDMNG